MDRAIPASKIKAKPVEWLPVLGGRRIPRGKITVLGGRPDQGKGLVAVHAAAELSRQKRTAKQNVNVLLSPQEDDPETDVRPRLEAAGAVLERVLVTRFGLPRDQNKLAAMVRKDKLGLVVMDPFAGHITSGISRGSDNIRILTQPLAELAEETGCAFLIVEHAIKNVPKWAPPLSALIGGSSGLPSVARASYLFGVDPADADMRILANIKLNVAKKPLPLRFEMDEKELDDVGEAAFLIPKEEIEGTFDAGILLGGRGSSKPGRPPDKRATASEWLAQYLFSHRRPVVAKKIYVDAVPFAISKRTLQNAAKDMGVIKEPEGGGAKCTWKLPPVTRKAMRLAAKKEAEG